MDQILFDETEETRTRYLGFILEGNRYDFALNYSGHFFGKTLVTCLQSNRSALLDSRDTDHPEYIAATFGLKEEEAQHLAHFLRELLGDAMPENQY
jgi:hypothetical protein